MTIKFQKWKKNLTQAFQSVFKTPRQVFIVSLLSVTIFGILILSSFPGYSFQMANSGPYYLYLALKALFQNMVKTGGWGNVFLTMIYSLFLSMGIMHGLIQIRARDLEFKGLASLGPGLLATGCAGCGAGILGILGFAGAIAVLPLEGSLLKVGGIILMIFFLGRSGDPKKCQINP